VTDREYYTNSFHVPVYYHCTAFHKLSVEAPYHALARASIVDNAIIAAQRVTVNRVVNRTVADADVVHIAIKVD